MIEKPSDKEQEYFLKLEVERLKKLRDEHQQKIAQQEREKLKKLHYMHCPKCGHELTTTSFEGVEIDPCVDCGGVWLDSGELAKLLEGNKQGSALSAIGRFRKLWFG